MTLLERLKDFDAYTKPLDDFRVRTFAGGAVTLVSSAMIIFMFVSETVSFLSVDIVEQLYVDSTPAEQRVDVNFDITFPRLPCSVITIDVMDLSGDNQDDIKDDVYKITLLNGKEGSGVRQGVNINATTISSAPASQVLCGSCYGAKNGCCNTCEEVKEAYMRKGWELVNIGTIEQCKSDLWVAGNFHIAPGDPLKAHRSHFHDLHSLSPSKFDTSHRVNHFSFGNSFPGKVYPLDGRFLDLRKIQATSKSSFLSHHISKRYISGESGLPGFFVQYEFSPLMVKYEEKRQYVASCFESGFAVLEAFMSLSTFLVSICAIIGGIFTVASLIDAFIYRSGRIISQKIALNKYT
ncbi:Endoplasmic reticulum-Golgi intermediate compartment protein 3 [Dirofilaria immitis]|nr:Endoplasmic reticulum-Golgi intermediate compartment protein 3 [Dirofilaria immitis]